MNYSSTTFTGPSLHYGLAHPTLSPSVRRSSFACLNKPQTRCVLVVGVFLPTSFIKSYIFILS